VICKRAGCWGSRTAHPNLHRCAASLQDKSPARQDKFVRAAPSRIAARADAFPCLGWVDKTIHLATQSTDVISLKTNTCAKHALGIVLATT
jgi:hypothetical protein